MKQDRFPHPASVQPKYITLCKAYESQPDGSR